MFSDKNFWRTTLTLALPIALQNLLSSSLSIIDNIMIGALGDSSIAAVGEAAQVAFLFNISMFGICSGGSVFAAQFWGRGNKQGIRHTYSLVMMNCIIIALLFSAAVFCFPTQAISIFTNAENVIEIGGRYIKIACFSYIGVGLNLGLCTILRSVEVVRLPVFSNIIAVSVNIFFNWVLIFGKLGFPALGVEGAAIATVIASFVNPAVILIVSFFKKYIVTDFSADMFRFPQGFVKRFYIIAAPVFFNEALWALGTSGVNMVFGRMGETNIAALTIARTVENIVFVFFAGVCNACAVIVGKYIGENKDDLVKEYAKRFTLIVPLMGLPLGTTIILTRGYILRIFNISPEVFHIASLLLLIYGIEVCFRNIPYICIVGIFRAGGDTKIGMIYDVCCLWFVSLPITAVLGLVVQLDFVLVYLIMLLCEDLLKNFLCIRHLFKFTWIHHVTEGKNTNTGE